MAKKKKEKSKAFKIAFITVIVMLAVLLLLIWQGIHNNYYHLSEQLNDAVSGLLADTGAGAPSAGETTRRKRASGLNVWHEYTRTIHLPRTVDLKAFLERIDEQAHRFRLHTVRHDAANGEIDIELQFGDKVLSHLMLVVERASGAEHHKRFAMVIDDVGSKRSLSPLIDLGIPLTFAILPFENHSRDIAQDLKGKQMPYILHLPLEPLDPKINPGKAALLMRMSTEKIRTKFTDDLKTVPGAVGVSNHMGSRFSEDEKKMELLMSLVKNCGLFYFDSYTTPKTQAPKAARAIRIRFRENDLFVDLEDTPEFMRGQFEHILKRFKKVDDFVAIGHIQKKSLEPVLKEYIPKFKAAGIEFVYLPELIPEQKK